VCRAEVAPTRRCCSPTFELTIELTIEPTADPTTFEVAAVQCSSSRYIGVTWDKTVSSRRVQLTDQRTKRHVGNYASEEDAARAYDWIQQERGAPT
jgi:hypothetical protein